jgi:hypothetical protein
LSAPLPLIVAAIATAVGGTLVPAYCVLVLAVVGLITAFTLPSARLTRSHSLDSDGPGTSTGPLTGASTEPAQRQKDYQG